MAGAVVPAVVAAVLPAATPAASAAPVLKVALVAPSAVNDLAFTQSMAAAGDGMRTGRPPRAIVPRSG